MLSLFDDIRDSLMPLKSGDFGFFSVEYHDDEDEQALKEKAVKGENYREEVDQATSDEDLHRTRTLIDMLQGAISAREALVRKQMAQGRTVTFKESGLQGYSIGRLALEPYPDQLLAQEGLEAFDLHFHRRVDLTDLLPDQHKMGAPAERDPSFSEYGYYPNLNPYYYGDYSSSAGEGALETRSPARPQQPKVKPPKMQVRWQLQPPKTQVRSVESVEAENVAIQPYDYYYDYYYTESEGSEDCGPPQAGNSSRAAVPYAAAASSAASVRYHPLAADKLPATRASAHKLSDSRKTKAPAQTTLRCASQVRLVTPAPQIQSAKRAPPNSSVRDAFSDEEKVAYVQYGYETASPNTEEEIEAYVYEYEEYSDSARQDLNDHPLNVEQTLYDIATNASTAPPPPSSLQSPPADFAHREHASRQSAHAALARSRRVQEAFKVGVGSPEAQLLLAQEEIEAYVYEYEEYSDSARQDLNNRPLNVEQTLYDIATNASTAPPPPSSLVQAAPQSPPADLAPTSSPPPSSTPVSPPSPSASSGSYYSFYVLAPTSAPPNSSLVEAALQRPPADGWSHLCSPSLYVSAPTSAPPNSSLVQAAPQSPPADLAPTSAPPPSSTPVPPPSPAASSSSYSSSYYSGIYDSNEEGSDDVPYAVVTAVTPAGWERFTL